MLRGGIGVPEASCALEPAPLQRSCPAFSSQPQAPGPRRVAPRSVARLMRLLWIGAAWLVVAMVWSAEGPTLDFEAGHANRAPTSWAQLRLRGAMECDHIQAEGLDVDAAAIAEPSEPIEWATATTATRIPATRRPRMARANGTPAIRSSSRPVRCSPSRARPTQVCAAASEVSRPRQRACVPTWRPTRPLGGGADRQLPPRGSRSAASGCGPSEIEAPCQREAPRCPDPGTLPGPGWLRSVAAEEIAPREADRSVPEQFGTAPPSLESAAALPLERLFQTRTWWR